MIFQEKKIQRHTSWKPDLESSLINVFLKNWKHFAYTYFFSSISTTVNTIVEYTELVPNDS